MGILGWGDTIQYITRSGSEHSTVQAYILNRQLLMDVVIPGKIIAPERLECTRPL